MAAAAMAACGSLPEPSAPPPPAPDPSAVSSGTALERFFPLVDGHIYQYAVERSNGEEPMVVRAGRSSARGGTLQLPGGEKRFEYTAEGIHLVAGGAPVFVLKEPLTVGNSWRGEHGGTVEIVEVDATAEVPAGSYTGCVKTLERRGGDRPMQVATTFCPEVGIVVLEAASGGEMERAALTSYGPPLDLGPDGVRRIP
jgi:hypothetical protein